MIILSGIQINFLARLIRMLQEQDIDAAMLYTSDHGEDIFDDDRHLSCMLHPFRPIIRYTCLF